MAFSKRLRRTARKNTRSGRAAKRTMRKMRRRQVRNRTTVPIGLGFPKKMVITHKYSDQLAINTGVAGAYSFYTWSCNSIFDPNHSGVGHQPLYFDQMASVYNHYTVIGSKITLRVSKSDSNVYVPILVGHFINDDPTVSSTSIANLIEQSSSKHRMITGYRPTTVIQNKWSAKKTFGGSVLSNDNLQGTVTTSPTEQSYYTVYFDSSANTTQTQVTLDVLIEYITVWDEIKDVTGS